MDYEETIKYFKHRLECGQCGKNTTQRKAFEIALDTLNFKKELIEEIPTFEHILNAQYEIFNKYEPFGSHTDVERIAWDESGRIMQDLQWLLDRLKECEIPEAEYGDKNNDN